MTYVYPEYWQSMVNSLRPSDEYMRRQSRPSLVQIMACRLIDTKPLSEPTLEYYSNIGNKLQCNLQRNSYFFIKKNTFQNVGRKMASISSQPQWVKILACHQIGAQL